MELVSGTISCIMDISEPNIIPIASTKLLPKASKTTAKAICKPTNIIRRVLTDLLFSLSA